MAASPSVGQDCLQLGNNWPEMLKCFWLFYKHSC